MIDRIEQLEQRRERAIDAAADTDALEELRVRYLGRKAELPNLLRGVAQLPPEERGAVGKAANAARQALEAPSRARERGARRPASSTRGWRRTASTSRCPATRPGQSGACT